MRSLIKKQNFSTTCTANDFSYLEKQYGILFPTELKNFLLNYEGLDLDRSQQFIPKSTTDQNTNPYHVSYVLYVLNAENKRRVTVEDHIAEYLEDEPSINYLIPFATSRVGWRYCYNVSEHEHGQIWLDAWSATRRFRFVSASLDEFLNSLQPNPNPEQE